MLFVLIASLCAVPVFAAKGSALSASDSETEAADLLVRMCDFLSQARQFSVNVRAGYDVVQETGQKIEFGESFKVTLIRPDLLRVDLERSDGEKVLMQFDGKQITVFNPNHRVFAGVAKPGDVDRAIFYLLNDLRLRLPLAMLFVTRLPTEMERRLRSLEPVEQDTIIGVPCAHLAGRTDQVDFQIWIPLQGDPLPRRVVITYKNEEGQPQFWANLSEWNLSPNPAEGFFTFTPPEGVQRIPFLAELDVAKSDSKNVQKGGKK